MKNKKTLVILFMIALAGMIFFSSYFIVKETEQVVITRFGKPVRDAISQAGLYFKLPLIDKANFFEKRILEWDGHVDFDKPIPTRDKKNIIVDTTARWRIVDPLKFLQTVGTEQAAQSRLDDIIDSNIRDVTSSYDLIEIVRNSNRVLDVIKKEYQTESFAASQELEEVTNQTKVGREEITRQILKKSQPIIAKYGVDLIDVRIKGLIYSKTVLENVYNRMISQYEIKSQYLRSEGDKKKSQIEGEVEFEVKKIQSEAYKQTQTIRGQGDAESTKIYAEAMNQAPDFYHFKRSLDAYEQAINKNSTLILGTDAEFYKVLKSGGK